MNRNEIDRYTFNPTNVDMSRSKIRIPHRTLTSFNVGELVPVDAFEVLPGDTWNMKTSLVARLQPLVTPVMDNLYLDHYWFFVPYRLIYDHWENLQGQNDTDFWTETREYTVPQINLKDDNGEFTSVKEGTLLDYFGIPANITPFNYSVSALPTRAYCKICNDWFVDENLVTPLQFDTGDANINYGSPTRNLDSYVTDCVKGGYPFTSAKLHDLFTSCLPSPQKGPEVNVNVGDLAPVIPTPYQFIFDSADTQQSKLYGLSRFTEFAEVVSDPRPGVFGHTYDGVDRNLFSSGANNSGALTFATPKSGAGVDSIHPIFNNLGADLKDATGVSINELRELFAVQRYYEKLARGGSRYIEILKSLFGVTSPDARLQRSEYLGGSRTPISITQVTQTSSTNSQPSPLGDVAGQSVTNDSRDGFVKSFVEHGIVICLATVRYKHTYTRGVPKMFKRKSKFDFYLPQFANIGEMPVFEDEIYLIDQSEDTDIQNDSVFGYQEAWANGYRYLPDRTTSEMSPLSSNSLSNWHFADNYSTPPTLGSAWIREDKTNVDRTLAVTSSVSNQVFADFYFDCSATRVMPLFSIPGLIDHH